MPSRNLYSLSVLGSGCPGIPSPSVCIAEQKANTAKAGSEKQGMDSQRANRLAV